jgi:hypothetical protein
MTTVNFNAESPSGCVIELKKLPVAAVATNAAIGSRTTIDR